MTVQPGQNERLHGRRRQWLPDVGLAMQNLGARKLRALLTMLGIIFGVAAVVSMLSIGAGAQQQVLAFIEQLGVRNLIVEAKDVTDTQELLKIRKTSPGLSFKDLRVVRANVSNLALSTPRKCFSPSAILPKPRQDTPGVYGVGPEYQSIAGLRLISGRFFSNDDNDARAPVCVLGEGAKANLIPAETGGRGVSEDQRAVAASHRGSRDSAYPGKRALRS